MTVAATAGGFVALAGHQVITSVFFLGCKFGDAISQTAQAHQLVENAVCPAWPHRPICLPGCHLKAPARACAPQRAA